MGPGANLLCDADGCDGHHDVVAGRASDRPALQQTGADGDDDRRHLCRRSIYRGPADRQTRRSLWAAAGIIAQCAGPVARLSRFRSGWFIVGAVPRAFDRRDHRGQPVDCRGLHRRCFPARRTFQEFHPDRHRLEPGINRLALGGIFGQLSLEAPAFVAAALALLSVLLGLVLLPESLPAEKRNTSPMSWRDYNPIAAIFDMARKPGLGLLLLVNGIFSFAFNGVSSTSALFVIQKFLAATWQVSLLLVLSGVSIALTNTFIVPRVIPLIGEKRSGVSSLMGLAVAYGVIFFAPGLWMMYPLHMLASCMNSFIFPVLTTLSAERVDVQEIGMLMGVTSAVGSLTNIFGPLWAGIVYDQVMLGAPYWMGALILLVSAWTFSRAKPRPQITIVQSSY